MWSAPTFRSVSILSRYRRKGLEQGKRIGIARVVSAVNPEFVRFRSLYVKGRSPLGDLVREGIFEIPTEDEIVEEIRLFIDSLQGVTTTLVSDHMLNLLQELEGKLPEDKGLMLEIIDSYLNMPEDERLMFQLARGEGRSQHSTSSMIPR